MMFLLAATAAASGQDTSPPPTPTQAELVNAITAFTHKPVAAADVGKIRCEGLFYDPKDDPDHSPPGYACRWDQRGGRGWLSYSSYFDFDKHRWRLKDHPDSDLPIDPASAEERRFRAWLIPRLRKNLVTNEDRLSYRYGYAFVDLNGDAHSEAIVTIRGRDTCGTGGCEMDVEAERRGVWRELSTTVRTRTPIRVLSTKHHGWHDIGVVDGGGGLPRTIESPVTFNGHEYDSSPTDSSVPKGVRGRTVLADKMVHRPLF